MSRPGPNAAAWVCERLRSDGHVHSTFSDGTSDPLENLRAATAAGLTRSVMADHVRADTDWLPRFVRAVDELRSGTAVDVRIGVESKILDSAGTLDLPARLEGVELLLIADHQVPTDGGPMGPATVRAELAAGRLEASGVIGTLVRAMMAAVSRADRPAVLVHPFSVLPKLGLAESDVPDELLRALGVRCRETGTSVEINEKWACPGIPVARLLVACGADLVAGSDAHASEAVGRYRYVRDVLEAVVPGATPA